MSGESVRRVGVYTRSAFAAPPLRSDESLSLQRKACVDYVRSSAELGWQLDPSALYEDSAASGFTLERPALQRLLVAVDRQAIHVIVVHRLDRVGVNIAHVEAVVARVRRAGAKLITLGVGDSGGEKVKVALTRLRRTL